MPPLLLQLPSPPWPQLSLSSPPLLSSPLLSMSSLLPPPPSPSPLPPNQSIEAIGAHCLELKLGLEIVDCNMSESSNSDEVYDLVEDDDTDSHISDIMECEHVPNEEVHTFDKTIDDEFLNKFPGKTIPNSNEEEVNDDDEASNEDDEVVFPVFDENQAWDKWHNFCYEFFQPNGI
ncbi:unnamed protein product [Lactuca saligna]|uniref:Uncharacterized protein n=1 Tax=Lactuca saligna TaxID=75948 RepID=A0AA36DZR4_LACSI|nr:unnamed protein product [Lactuca saligna]